MSPKNEKTETIRLTNGQMEAMVFNQAFQQAVKQPFPVKASYWLGRALDKITQEFKPFQKAVQEIVEKYAEKEINDNTRKHEVKRRPDGQPVWGENEKQATAEIDELKGIEVDLGIHRIHLDLDKCEEMKITPSPETFALLMPLLDDPDGF